jgi:hypothetical protein
MSAAQTTRCGLPNPYFGVNYDDQSQPLSVLTTAMSKIYGAHKGMVRLVAFWKNMETTQGTINFSVLDDRVNSAYNAGLTIVLTFYGIPNWANGSPAGCDFWAGQCSAPPTNSTYFGNFASAVANRYKDKISYYEVWNEPDSNVFWTGSMAQLSSLIVHPAAVSIRAAATGATILGPAMYSSKLKLQNVLSAPAPTSTW